MDNEVIRTLTEIRERVVRVETKIDSMTDVKATAEAAEKIAIEALQSTKSAHHRIDELKDNEKWLKRAVATALLGAFASGALAIFWRGLGG